MKYKLITVVFLLVFCLAMSYFVSVVKAASVDSWADVEIVSFDGESILFNLQVTVRGDHTADNMWIKIEPTSTSSTDGSFAIASIEVWRGIVEKIYYQGTNTTVFSYFYSYNSSFYKAEPKFLNFLLFPADRHSVTFYLGTSFNITMDEHPKICELPSQNYEGTFQVSSTPTNDRPTMYTVAVSIQHSDRFFLGVMTILGIILVSLYALTVYLITLTIVVIFRKKPKNLSNVVPVSSAIIFFVPAFELLSII